jgi:hypothetical protein
MTTITRIGLDTYDVHSQGVRIARTTAHVLEVIDQDIAETVAKARELPGTPVEVPSTAKTPAPRYSRVYAVLQ